MQYKTCRIIDGKPKWVITKNGKIINQNPNKDELKKVAKEEQIRTRVTSGIYNLTNTCDECKITRLRPGNSYKKYDKLRNWTGKYICNKCYKKNYGNKIQDIRKPKGDGIFKQYWIENIKNISTDYESISSIPRKCGVYIITTEDGDVYVGSSINIRRRISQHLIGGTKELKKSNKIDIYLTNYKNRPILEQKFIEYFCPTLNKRNVQKQRIDDIEIDFFKKNRF